MLFLLLKLSLKAIKLTIIDFKYKCVEENGSRLNFIFPILCDNMPQHCFLF